MPIQILVESGPDKGRAFRIGGQTEVRLGRGAGCHFALKDPAWQGTLRVELSRGIFRVTNDMATAIYLGSETFPPREQRTWYHGARLQPTADTTLVLLVDAPEAGKQPKAAFEELAPAPLADQKSRSLQIAVIVICFALAAVLFLAPSDLLRSEAKTRDEWREEYKQTDLALTELLSDPAYSRLASAIQPRLKDARFWEAWDRPGPAYENYLRVRDELERELTNPAPAETLPPQVTSTLTRVRAFVNHRLIALAPAGKDSVGLH